MSRADFAKRALLRDLVARPGGAWVTCAGASMEPTIRRGARVRIVACERVRAGDVVLFDASRGPVLHRVVLVLPGTGWFLHIGDAGSGDGPGLARLDRVIGRAPVARRLPGPRVLWASGLRLWRAARRGRVLTPGRGRGPGRGRAEAPPCTPPRA